MEIEHGAEVIDKNGKRLGTVDYPVRDTLTGEIRSFEVNTPHTDTDLFFSTEDLLEVSPARAKLKFSFDEIGQMK